MTTRPRIARCGNYPSRTLAGKTLGCDRLISEQYGRAGPSRREVAHQADARLQGLRPRGRDDRRRRAAASHPQRPVQSGPTAYCGPSRARNLERGAFCLTGAHALTKSFGRAEDLHQNRYSRLTRFEGSKHNSVKRCWAHWRCLKGRECIFIIVNERLLCCVRERLRWSVTRIEQRRPQGHPGLPAGRGS